MEIDCTTIYEIGAISSIQDDEIEDFGYWYSDHKGSNKLYGLHWFLDGKPSLKLLATDIDNYHKVLKYIFEDTGIDLSDVGKSGANHTMMIVTDDIGFIIHKTGIMNY